MSYKTDLDYLGKVEATFEKALNVMYNGNTNRADEMIEERLCSTQSGVYWELKCIEKDYGSEPMFRKRMKNIKKLIRSLEVERLKRIYALT